LRDALRTSFHEAGHITVSHVLGVQADRAILGNFGGGSTQYAADAAMDYETTGICALAGIAVEEALFPSEMRLMGHAVLYHCRITVNS